MFGFLITSVPIRDRTRTSSSTASKRIILILYRGIHRSSRAIIWGYPYVLKAYPIRATIYGCTGDGGLPVHRPLVHRSHRSTDHWCTDPIGPPTTGAPIPSIHRCTVPLVPPVNRSDRATILPKGEVKGEKSDSPRHLSIFPTRGFPLEKGYFKKLTIFYKV
jgi:hypothetical protein